MLSIEMISRQAAYNQWANERIFEKAAQVSEEDFRAQSIVEGRSLQQILAHMVRIEKVWRLMARDQELAFNQLPAEEQLSSVDVIKDFAQEEQEKLERYLQQLDQEALSQSLQIKRWDGVQVTMARWQILVHMLMHSMQHRTEAAVLLTRYGHSPGNLDFLFFVV